MKKKEKFEVKEEHFMRNGALLLEKQISYCQGRGNPIRIFSAQDLIKATNNYDASLIHTRMKSTLYKGNLEGRIVAVKTPEGLQVSDWLAEFFLNQVVLQIQTHHKHIIKLLGCCLETQIPIIVLEFIPNNTLANWITSPSAPFSWSNRLRIATDIADAVTYLHCVNSNPIIHRDIRSTNILLDENYVSKLTNFGFSVVISSGKSGTEFGIKGVQGYIDPEYIETSRLTEKCDVYSFGIVLVELLCWKMVETEPLFVQNFVVSMENVSLHHIWYDSIEGEAERAQSLAYATLALRCIRMKGEDRPTMMEVVKELRRIGGYNL